MKSVFLLLVLIIFFHISLSGQKVYAAEYESQADLKIYIVNYKSQAGWNKTEKQHLLL